MQQKLNGNLGFCVPWGFLKALGPGVARCLTGRSLALKGPGAALRLERSATSFGHFSDSFLRAGGEHGQIP